MNIGMKIQTLRLKQGLTQSDLAKGICDRSHISMIEAGNTSPSFAMLEKLATRLHVTLSDILSDSTVQAREESFSFRILMDHLESLFEEEQYLDICVLIRKYLRHSEISKSPSKLAQMYRYSGICETMLENYDRAEELFFKSQQYAKESRDADLLMDTNVSIGALYNKRFRFEQSEQIYNNALAQSSKEINLFTKTKIYFGLGLSMEGQGRFKEALTLLKSHLERLLHNNSLFLIGEISACIATCYEQLKRYEEAIPYYQKVVAYHQFRENPQKASRAYEFINNCQKTLTQQKKAEIVKLGSSVSQENDTRDLLGYLVNYNFLVF